ncbi:lipopolysaccharide biosynthesis protein [Kamptonema formosum]|uniref:lipopolysaccharide biosynthesis protein n=1 Tax=Kamptonema formosum TaxID=331992 RepID=UPI000345FBB6|nr:lipopolysaccharide biosynthesis protein [Oscillatoria sp. PCC 10802]
MSLDFLKKKLSNPFIRNIGWLSGSELIIRIFRLVTTVVLARLLTPYDYGLAAVVLTTNEFTRVFSRNGIGAKLIQAGDENLETLCNAAYWLNWVVLSSLFVIQCAVAFPIAWLYHDSQLILPICVTGLVYLMIPIAAVQSALIRRDNRLKIQAFASTLQISADNVLTLIFALLGMGMWAIVLPKVLVGPIWVAINYTNHPWRRTSGFTTQYWREIFIFGRNVLGVELLKTLRNNLDYLIIGRFLGIQALGLYYFAFNAGLGISISIINGINSALLPHLCAVRSEVSKFKARYFSSLKTITTIIVPLVLLQSSLAPFYVPVVFGQKWVGAIPILVLICLSAIPRPFADAASQLLLAVDKPDVDLRWNMIFTALFTGGLLVGVQWDATGVAASVFLTHVILLPLFTVWASRYVFVKFLQPEM